MIFLRSFPKTLRGGYLDGCSALVVGKGVTPRLIMVVMINLNWLLELECAQIIIYNNNTDVVILYVFELKIDLLIIHYYHFNSGI